MVTDGVLGCLRLGILERISQVYRFIKLQLWRKYPDKYVDLAYKNLMDAVEFYFQHEIFGDREIRRKLRVINALYQQYEDMKKRTVA